MLPALMVNLTAQTRRTYLNWDSILLLQNHRNFMILWRKKH